MAGCKGLGWAEKEGGYLLPVAPVAVPPPQAGAHQLQFLTELICKLDAR